MKHWLLRLQVWWLGMGTENEAFRRMLKEGAKAANDPITRKRCLERAREAVVLVEQLAAREILERMVVPEQGGLQMFLELTRVTIGQYDRRQADSHSCLPPVSAPALRRCDDHRVRSMPGNTVPSPMH